jgi:hypothetical protein
MTVQALLTVILDALQCPYQLGIQDAGPVTTHNEISKCAASCAAHKGLKTDPATSPELAAAVQRLINAMPTKDELAALQAADPETKELLEWFRKGRQKSAVDELPSKWRKEVKYLHLLDGVLFYRPVLDPHGDMVDVPVLPASLRRGALMAMHYKPLMCHPADKALFALARKRYYWPGLSSDCKTIVHQCGHCDRAQATLRMGAGMTKPALLLLLLLPLLLPPAQLLLPLEAPASTPPLVSHMHHAQRLASCAQLSSVQRLQLVSLCLRLLHHRLWEHHPCLLCKPQILDDAATVRHLLPTCHPR